MIKCILQNSLLSFLIRIDDEYEVPGVVKFRGTEGRTMVARIWREQGMGSFCLIHTEFQGK